MKSSILAVMVACLPSVSGAQGFEEAAVLSQKNFAALLGGFRLGVGKPIVAAVPAKSAFGTAVKTAPKAAAAAADLETLFVGGAKPAEGDLRGWFAGRRFTQSGPTAALLAGTDVYSDPNQGPIAGKSFKILLWGADKVIEGLPETIYDEPGSETLNTIAWNIYEQGGQWSRSDFTQDKSVLTRKGESLYEVRKSGDWLVARYPNGDYGYFFKKVR